MNFKKETDKRIGNRRKKSLLDVNTLLEHFAIISFKVPADKVKKHIPNKFKLWTFCENGSEYALVSAVSFKDKDFRFYRIGNYPKFNFYQTNYRTYIIDKRDNSYAAWFFGTTLGSTTCIIPEKIWKMPWRKGKYKFEFSIDQSVYTNYSMSFSSQQGSGKIKLTGTNKNMTLLNGFTSIDEQIHILTHPVKGYYNINNDEIGEYEIWHPLMDLKEYEANHLYFEFLEKLGFLNKNEMNSPHSVLVTPKIEFDILLPPEKFTSNQ